VARLWFLTIQCDDGGENVGNLLWCVELTSLLTGTGDELAD